MPIYRHFMAKKSIYLLCSAVLGLFLFLVLHRVVVFVILFTILSSSAIDFYAANYRQFLAWDYITLLAALIAGSWYGLWVGGYWYEKVYETGVHGGFLSHLTSRLYQLSDNQNKLRKRVEIISRELKEDAWQFEDLAKSVPKRVVAKKPAVRRIIKRKVVKKSNDI